jgi:MYXO-CTERM domain-containing protein
MRTTTPQNATTFLFLATLLAACGGSRPEGTESQEEVFEHLYPRSTVLWPVVDGKATIRVCWLPAEIGEDKFPVAKFAPKLAEVLPIRKQWTREIVEAEWNARTPLNFVGWQDCDGSYSDFALRPISSAYRPKCASAGQSCAEAFGTDLRDDRLALNLNLLFGDELLYSSRYQQSAPGRQYDAALDIQGWWTPQACMVEFHYPWSTNNGLTSYALNIEEPSVLAQFEAIYKNCLQYNVLHEFGHAAGFAHEQYRPDDPAKQAECYAYETANGLKDDMPSEIDPQSQYLGTTPLGPFDTESIMSYCRRDPSARITATDAAMTAQAYAAAVDGGSRGSVVDGDGGSDGSNMGNTASGRTVVDGGRQDSGGKSDGNANHTAVDAGLGGSAKPRGDSDVGGAQGCAVAAGAGAQPSNGLLWLVGLLLAPLRVRKSKRTRP